MRQKKKPYNLINESKIYAYKDLGGTMEIKLINLATKAQKRRHGSIY